MKIAITVLPDDHPTPHRVIYGAELVFERVFDDWLVYKNVRSPYVGSDPVDPLVAFAALLEAVVAPRTGT